MPTETSLHFAADHPAFAGHFPGQPMVPGALLLDAVVHAITQTQAEPCSADTGSLCAWQIASAKFLSPVQPGETLTLSWVPGAAGSSRFTIVCGKRQIASGTVLAEAREVAS